MTSRVFLLLLLDLLRILTIISVISKKLRSWIAVSCPLLLNVYSFAPHCKMNPCVCLLCVCAGPGSTCIGSSPKATTGLVLYKLAQMMSVANLTFIFFYLYIPPYPPSCIFPPSLFRATTGILGSRERRATLASWGPGANRARRGDPGPWA